MNTEKPTTTLYYDETNHILEPRKTFLFKNITEATPDTKIGDIQYYPRYCFKLYTAAMKRGITHDEVIAQVKEQHGVESTKLLTKEQFTKLKSQIVEMELLPQYQPPKKKVKERKKKIRPDNNHTASAYDVNKKKKKKYRVVKP